MSKGSICRIAAPFLVIALTNSSTASATQPSAIPHFRAGTSYLTVRAKLSTMGWRPMRVAGAPGCGGQQNCTPFHEAVYCTGTGSAACLYAWKKGSVGIEVWTEGEQDPPEFNEIRRCHTRSDLSWGQKGSCP